MICGWMGLVGLLVICVIADFWYFVLCFRFCEFAAVCV